MVHSVWHVGSVEIERVEYFDVAVPAASIGLDGVVAGIGWADPWTADGQPLVGQAFWLIRSDDSAYVVDPCGAADAFLRTGPDAVAHEEAAFAALGAAGHDPAELDGVVLTHLDGIGMAALADGSPPGSERWRPAFSGPLRISRPEYDHVMREPESVSGGIAFAQLDDQGIVEVLDVADAPHPLAPGVTLRRTGGHSPGHCVVDIESDGRCATLLGHLAVSPLHAAAGRRDDALHMDTDAGWNALREVLTTAVDRRAILFGSLWPDPGAARVDSADPFVLSPAPPNDET